VKNIVIFLTIPFKCYHAHTQSSLTDTQHSFTQTFIFHCRPHHCNTSLVFMSLQLKREIPLNSSLKILTRLIFGHFEKLIVHLSSFQKQGGGVFPALYSGMSHRAGKKRWLGRRCFIFSRGSGDIFRRGIHHRRHNEEARGTKNVSSSFKASLPFFLLTVLNFWKTS